MSVGQLEIRTQKRVIDFFRDTLGYSYLGDWLDTGTVASQLRTFRSFEDARKFSRSLVLKNVTEWRQYTKGNRPDLPPFPDDIPANPNQTYRDKGWLSWPDFLGTSPGKKPRTSKKNVRINSN